MKKILLIEEQRETADDLRELLGLSNYAVISASDGRQGMTEMVTSAPVS